MRAQATIYHGRMDAKSLGLVLVVVGALVVLVGLGVMLGLLGWFGRLPGDVRIESDNVRVYVPIVSMLLISVVLTVLLAVVARLR